MSRNNVPAARILRSRQTISEAMAWETLRGRRFQGLKFRRQHPIGAYVVDFYCEEANLAVEIDGGIHRIEENRVRDAERTEVLRELGVRIVRVPVSEVESGNLMWLQRINLALIPGSGNS